MTISKVGDWGAARAAVSGMGERMLRATQRATMQEAQLFRSLAVRAFNTGGRSNGEAWARNQPGTIRAKGSSKPLIDSGQLRNSVAVVKIGQGVFVGVPSNTRREGGGPLVSIAEVHEYGKVIAQQRGGSIVLIKIPARSFIGSTASKHFSPRDVSARYFARVAIGMGAGWTTQAPPSARALAKGAMPVKTKKLKPLKGVPKTRQRGANGRFKKG